ncbi:glycoside hydrolase family protein [Polyangium sp. 15x6]|uniref:glycoside hydrolase family protein n=1 Tax=Polyangium sp. 15x6 TaxID=3042687 RepID=UPI00249A0A1D|nr:glycoside hydrolase family protein [Polyangium sp. 15x6]MDI3287839.1 glycoside hydrolase family protein [Polyangium sp. 15x6]
MIHDARTRWFSGAAAMAALVFAASCGSSEPSPGSGSGAGSGSGGAGAGGSMADGSSSSSTGGGPPINPSTGCKRGVAYGYHSKADMQALSTSVSWWYNWAHVPDEGVKPDAYKALGVEYVPMVWGGGGLDSMRAAQIASEIPDGTSFLLGFNEPNFGEQANLSASEAAALWPHVEAVADARGLALVSPAVNFCGGACQETDPFKYLDEFFAACEGCRVDYIGIHIYTACQGDGTNKARWLINHIETYKTRFDKPIWLTEFACDNAGSLAEQKDFMIDALEYLENEPRIARYAWFSGRANNVANANLLGEDGVLTELGKAYVDAPQKPCE